MLVWTLLNDNGPGIAAGLVVASPFVALSIALFMARDKFGEKGSAGEELVQADDSEQ
jgi:hypothetical protein